MPCRANAPRCTWRNNKQAGARTACRFHTRLNILGGKGRSRPEGADSPLFLRVGDKPTPAQNANPDQRDGFCGTPGITQSISYSKFAPINAVLPVVS